MDIFVIQREVLWCKAQNSDKVYIPVIMQIDGTNEYIVFADYGKRGSALRRAIKGTFSNRAIALQEFLKLKSDKLAKGYQAMPSDFYCGTHLPYDLEHLSADLLKPTLNKHYGWDL